MSRPRSRPRSGPMSLPRCRLRPSRLSKPGLRSRPRSRRKSRLRWRPWCRPRSNRRSKPRPRHRSGSNQWGFYGPHNASTRFPIGCLWFAVRFLLDSVRVQWDAYRFPKASPKNSNRAPMVPRAIHMVSGGLPIGFLWFPIGVRMVSNRTPIVLQYDSYGMSIGYL